MKTISTTTLVLALGTCMAGCASTQYQTRASGRPKGGAHTFALQSADSAPAGWIRASLPTTTKPVALESGARVLAEHGLEPAPFEGADLVAYVGVGRRIRIRQEVVPGGAALGSGHVVVEDKENEGCIAVTVFERGATRPVWHGTVRGAAASGWSPDQVREAVAELARRFVSETDLR